MTIHALPGMGADHSMYPPPWNTLPGFVAHDWIRHSGEQSIADVATSMADSCGIREGDVIVGSSLGGMVACEIARIRNISNLFLIGSAVDKSEVNRLLAAMAPLAQYAPINWVRASVGKIPGEFAQMFAGIEPSFIRAMCPAIFAWEGLRETQARVLRIHGSHDIVIPPPEDPDLSLEGGHLISITHARECVEFVRSNLIK